MRAINLPSPTGKAGAKSSKAQGFTLLELLVALAILAGGLALALASFSQALDRNREDQAQEGARSLEASLLAQALARPDPSFGAQDGGTGLYRWRVEYSPYGSESDQSAWNGRAAKITVTVSWRRGMRVRQIGASSLRLFPGVPS